MAGTSLIMLIQDTQHNQQLLHSDISNMK